MNPPSCLLICPQHVPFGSAYLSNNLLMCMSTYVLSSIHIYFCLFLYLAFCCWFVLVVQLFFLLCIIVYLCAVLVCHNVSRHPSGNLFPIDLLLSTTVQKATRDQWLVALRMHGWCRGIRFCRVFANAFDLCLLGLRIVSAHWHRHGHVSWHFWSTLPKGHTVSRSTW